MKEKTTSDLNGELMSEAGIDAYIHENKTSFVELSMTQCITALYLKKSISKAALARKAEISEVYLHQVFSGRRYPSRDRLLCLCFGLEATLEETQELLKQSGYALLYPKVKRDAIVLHGLVHGTGVGAVNNKLFAEEEKALY